MSSVDEASPLTKPPPFPVNKYEVAALSKVVASVPPTDSRWIVRGLRPDKQLRDSGIEFARVSYTNAELNRLAAALEETQKSLNWDDDTTWKFILEAGGLGFKEFWPVLFMKAKLPHRSCESMQQAIRRHLVPDNYYRKNMQLTKEEKELLAEVQKGEVKMSLGEMSEMMKLPKYVIDDYLGILRRGYNQGSKPTVDADTRLGLPAAGARSKWLCAALVTVYGADFPFHMGNDPAKTPEILEVYKRLVESSLPDKELPGNIFNTRQWPNIFHLAMQKASGYAFRHITDKDALSRHIVRQIAAAVEGTLKLPGDSTTVCFPATRFEQVQWKLVAPFIDAHNLKAFYTKVLLGKVKGEFKEDTPFEEVVDKLWDAWELADEQTAEERKAAEECEHLVRTYIMSLAVSVDESLKDKVPESYNIDGIVIGLNTKGKKGASPRDPPTTQESAESDDGSSSSSSSSSSDSSDSSDSDEETNKERVDEKSVLDIVEARIVDEHPSTTRPTFESLSKEKRCQLLALVIIDGNGLDFRFPAEEGDAESSAIIANNLKRELGKRGMDGEVSEDEVMSLLRHIIRHATKQAWEDLEDYQAFVRYILRSIQAAVKGTLPDKNGRLLEKISSRDDIPWKTIAPFWNPSGLRSVFKQTVLPVLEGDTEEMSLKRLIKRLMRAWSVSKEATQEEIDAYAECEKSVRDYFLSLACKADPSVKSRAGSGPAPQPKKEVSRSPVVRKVPEKSVKSTLTVASTSQERRDPLSNSAPTADRAPTGAKRLSDLLKGAQRRSSKRAKLH